MAAEPRHARHAALVRALEAEELDALLVTSRANIRYLTGFSGSAALAVATRADLLLVTDFRYDEQARAEAGAVARVEVDGASVWDRLFRELPSLGALAWIGYEAHALAVKDAERLAQAGKAWRWKATGDLVERLRASKDPGEVAAIRSAAALAGEALTTTLTQVRVGMSELEITGLLEGELRRRGSEGHPFPTIVASGPRTALPHARSSQRTVAAGEWLLLDFGAQVDGYCADVTRTVVVGGRASERQRAQYELVRGAQLRAREGVRAGMTGRDADALARELIEARGIRNARPELGGIEVRRGWLGAWAAVRVSRAGHPTNTGGEHVVVAERAVVPLAGPSSSATAEAAGGRREGGGAPAGVALLEIKSPSVGTFYSAPEPGAEP